MERRDFVLDKINPSRQEGLELGPLTSPIVLKSEGPIKYVDHVDQAGLRLKYANDPNVHPHEIVEIDYTLGKGSLTDAVRGRRFDYVVAAHVIEHVPDVLGWLEEIAEVLKPGGILSLAIPDGRYTFDVLRRLSTPAEVIGSHLDRLKRPSSTQMFDFAINYLDVDSSELWAGGSLANKWRRYDLNQVVDMCRRNLGGEYVDCHCFVFTPDSFIHILRTVMELDMTRFEVASFFPTTEGALEFYVSLRKLPQGEHKFAQLASLPEEKGRLNPDQRSRELEALVKQYQSDIDSLKNSTIWRVSAPLRILADYWKGVAARGFWRRHSK